MCGAVVVRHRPFSCFCVTEQHPARVWRVAFNIPVCSCRYGLPHYSYCQVMIVAVWACGTGSRREGNGRCNAWNEQSEVMIYTL